MDVVILTAVVTINAIFFVAVVLVVVMNIRKMNAITQKVDALSDMNDAAAKVRAEIKELVQKIYSK